MRQYRYHLTQVSLGGAFPDSGGWLALLGSDAGLRRLSLKPTPAEALEGLAPDGQGAPRPAGTRMRRIDVG